MRFKNEWKKIINHEESKYASQSRIEARGKKET